MARTNQDLRRLYSRIDKSLDLALGTASEPALPSSLYFLPVAASRAHVHTCTKRFDDSVGILLFGQSLRCSANGAALVRDEWETGINDTTRK